MEAALNGPSGRTTLGANRLTIGRTPDNQLVVSDPQASSRHAEIRPEGQGYSLVDLGSTNGTYLNGERMTPNMPRMLNPGDTIRFGNTTFTYEANAPYQAGPTVAGSGSSPGYQPTIFANPSSAPPTAYGAGAAQNYAPPPAYDNPYAQQGYADPTQMASGSPNYYGSGAQQGYVPPAYPSYNQQGYVPPMAQGGGIPTYTPPQQPTGGGRGRGLTIALVVVALLVILGGVGGFFVYHNNQVAQENTNATATAHTNQLNANATGTAQVNATATALVTSHFPPFTNLALHEPLTSSSSDWASSSTCQFTAAGYQASIAQTNTIQHCLNTGGQFGEMAIQVNITIQQGDCGGIDFRFLDARNFYFFEICQNGTYNVGDFINGTENLRYTQLQSSSAIQQGLNKQNVIALTVQGNTVSMYVNGRNIDSATSGALTNSTFSRGGIGLLADDEGNSTSVVYTNLLVWVAA